jgi:hypothetical protein
LVSVAADFASGALVVPARLFPVFRDRDELAAAADLLWYLTKVRTPIKRQQQRSSRLGERTPHRGTVG